MISQDIGMEVRAQIFRGDGGRTGTRRWSGDRQRENKWKNPRFTCASTINAQEVGEVYIPTPCL